MKLPHKIHKLQSRKKRKIGEKKGKKKKKYRVTGAGSRKVRCYQDQMTKPQIFAESKCSIQREREKERERERGKQQEKRQKRKRKRNERKKDRESERANNQTNVKLPFSNETDHSLTSTSPVFNILAMYTVDTAGLLNAVDCTPMQCAQNRVFPLTAATLVIAGPNMGGAPRGTPTAMQRLVGS
jgi:hypothetical protein